MPWAKVKPPLRGCDSAPVERHADPAKELFLSPCSYLVAFGIDNLPDKHPVA